MKRVLVVGGAGEVGEGIVAGLLAGGNSVWAQSRSEARLGELATRLGNPVNLATAIGDINTEEQASALANHFVELELDAVVASIGSWWSGPALVDLDLPTFQRVMDERLTTHFLAAKAFLPLLAEKPGASYTFIHGASGFIPIPHSGPVSIAGAAQVMLKDVFAKEMESAAVRINLVSMMSSIATRSHPSEDPEAITAQDVGNYINYLVSDSASGVRGQTIKFSHRREIPG